MNPSTATPSSIEQISEDFIRACNKQDYPAMGDLLKKGARIDEQNTKGISPLLSALLAKNEDMALWLLDRGASPLVRTNTGDNALIEAASKGHDITLKAMIKKLSKEELNTTNNLGSTALMEACAQMQRSAIKLLLSAGADPHIKSTQGTSAILISATRHDFESVELLLKKDVDPSSRDAYGVPALIAASQNLSHYEKKQEGKDSLKTVKALLRGGADYNAKANSGNTPLAEAASTWNREVIKELLLAGANPNVHSTAGVRGETTPLMICALKHDLELMDLAIKKGANINFQNNKGETALGFALLRLNPDEKAEAEAKTKEDAAKIEKDAKEAAQKAISMLLEKGAVLGPKQKMGLGHFAVLIDDEALVARAATAGLLDFQDEEGHTAVHLAVHLKKDKMLEALLNAGASKTLPDKDGMTPAHMYYTNPGVEPRAGQLAAVLKQQKDEKKKVLGEQMETQLKASMAKLEELVISGVDLEARNKKGDTILAVAMTAYGMNALSRERLDALVERGADITARNENEDSPFITSIKLGDEKLATSWAEKLIAQGKVDLVESALMDVCWTAPEHPRAVTAMKPVFEALQKLGAKINYQDEDGQTPLIVASATNQEDLVHMLLEIGAEVDLRNKEGETALIQTISNNRPNISRILLEKGADINITTTAGEDAMAVAYRYHAEFRSTGILDQLREARQKNVAPSPKPGFR